MSVGAAVLVLVEEVVLVLVEEVQVQEVVVEEVVVWWWRTWRVECWQWQECQWDIPRGRLVAAVEIQPLQILNSERGSLRL